MFVVIMVRIYTLPLFAVRPMYLTMRAFKKALNDVILSRRAIHNMNNWYPDATAEELANTDNVCIICREEMLAPTTKKLPCNHIFHKSCLRSWFQRQQTCPTCRLDVLRAPVQGGQPRPRQQQQRPQQQQQQQQQPAPPQFPGFDPNFFAQMAAAANGGLPPNAAATGATGHIRPPPLPPFMMPHMPFFPPPPMFNLPPPPMPPPNFAGLTDAELQALEGQERVHVEARIKVLRNIQVLLDAAVMEMNQYSSVVNRLNLNLPPAPTPVAAPPTNTTASTGAAPVSSTTSDAASNLATETASKSEETGTKPKTAAKDEPELDRDEELPQSSNGAALSEEQMDLRRRRLEKFAAPKNESQAWKKHLKIATLATICCDIFVNLFFFCIWSSLPKCYTIVLFVTHFLSPIFKNPSHKRLLILKWLICFVFKKGWFRPIRFKYLNGMSNYSNCKSGNLFTFRKCWSWGLSVLI